MVLFHLIGSMNGFVREARIGFAFVHLCAKDAVPAADSFSADTNGLISVAYKHEWVGRVTVLRARIVHFCADFARRLSGRRDAVTIQYVPRRWEKAGDSIA